MYSGCLTKLSNLLGVSLRISTAQLHTTSTLAAWSSSGLPRKFLKSNKKIYPPQQIGEEKRPAFVCHQKTNLKYSVEKMWYVAVLVRGMSVDEAIKQLSYVLKKGGKYAKEAIEEAQKIAVEQHNVEFKSNLWVAESIATKGKTVKGFRRHARGRMGEVRYKYCHYFVRLEEGPPPVDYYKIDKPTPQEQLDSWLSGMHKRKIINSL